MNGTIVRVLGSKGFGFIKGEDGKEYFFHREGVQGFFDDIVEDFEKVPSMKVTFDSVPSQKGPRAENVVVL